MDVTCECLSYTSDIVCVLLSSVFLQSFIAWFTLDYYRSRLNATVSPLFWEVNADGEDSAREIPEVRLIALDNGGHLLMGQHKRVRSEFRKVVAPYLQRPPTIDLSNTRTVAGQLARFYEPLRGGHAGRCLCLASASSPGARECGLSSDWSGV